MSEADVPISTNDGACQSIADMWDRVIEDFLEGRATNTRPPLDRYFMAYAGRGRGAVDTTCMPEPYLGDILSTPRAAILALNPGDGVPRFQASDGIFADEIRRLGSYRAWASSWPYLTGSWLSAFGVNRHHQVRMEFLRRWFRHPGMPYSARVDFELYPWHSRAVTARIRPDPGIVRDFIWAPLAELPVEFIFAFGKPWFDVLPHLPDVSVVDRIGDGGRPYATTSKPRAKRAFVKASTPTKAWLIVGKHTGSATPPAEIEIPRIKHAFGFE